MPDRDAGKPLLLDFDTHDPCPTDRNVTAVSLRALETGEEEWDTLELRPSRSVIERLLMAVRKRNVAYGKEQEFDPVRFPHAEKEKSARRDCRIRRCGLKTIWVVPLLVVVLFGVVHIPNFLRNLVDQFRDEALPHDFLPLDQYLKGDFTGLTRNVKPIHCHSHNDYWRRVPLFEALRWGCTGVEADVWLFPKRSDELLVGHSKRDLTTDHTFRSMYLDPLMGIIDQRNSADAAFEAIPKTDAKNGVFEMDPTQTLVLLVDFKNDGHELYPIVSEQLEPLRQKGYLSYYDGRTLIPGPLTIVATGNAPFDLVTNNTDHRDIFFDAPLAHLSSQGATHKTKRASGQGTVGTTPLSTFDLTNSYYASVDFKKAVGWCWFGRLSSHQKELIRMQIRSAKERGLKSRYWGAPKWPVSVRNMVWRVLVEEGVDYLNGDDLRDMTTGDWGAKIHGSWME